MGEFLIAHLGVPLFAGIVFVFMVAASDTEPLSLAKCNDIALDLVVLSIGANGAIFVNPRLISHWQAFTPVVGITVVLANLLLASFLLYRRRWRQGTPSKLTAYFDLFMGVPALVITTGVFYLGYEPASGGQQP